MRRTATSEPTPALFGPDSVEQALLDTFAGIALGGILANPALFMKLYDECGFRGVDLEAHLASYSFDLAGAMVAERSRRVGA